MWKYALAWTLLVVIAIVNGALREGWYGKYVGELAAHQLSTASGVLLFGIYIWIVMRMWPPQSAGMALTIGLMWLVQTVAFEFLFGHFIRGLPWNVLLYDYNIFAGRLWLLVLACVTFTPTLFHLLHRK